MGGRDIHRHRAVLWAIVACVAVIQPGSVAFADTVKTEGGVIQGTVEGRGDVR